MPDIEETMDPITDQPQEKTLKVVTISVDRDNGDYHLSLDEGFSPVELWGMAKLLDTQATNLFMQEMMRKQMEDQMDAAKQRGGLVTATIVPQDHHRKASGRRS